MVWGERASERISARGIVVPQSDTAVFAASVTSVLLIHPTRVLYTLSNIPHHLIDARSTEIIAILNLIEWLASSRVLVHVVVP